MNTTYFKYENESYYILFEAGWTLYNKTDQGKAISSLITEKMRVFYTKEEEGIAEKTEAEDSNTDEGITLNNSFWIKQKELSDEVMQDFVTFETNLREGA